MFCLKPRYLSLDEEEFSRKVDELEDMLSSCKLCGNECGVNRLDGEIGKCGAGKDVKISSYSAHYGEEPPLVGEGGSGTVFLSYCPMTCVYCQNWRISRRGYGSERGVDDVAKIMLSLQKTGCHNVNWVTPTHYVPKLVEALKVARSEGLKIPVVYNTGGYDNPEVIRVLDGVIDIYMPDIKYGSDENGKKYSDVEGYWKTVRENLKEMHRQVGCLEINEERIAEKGVLIRHLVLPGGIAESEEVLKFVAEEISPDSYINIMSQYRPEFKACEYDELSRRVRPDEIKKVKERARDFGLYRGFQ